jgi:HAD superfamily 5'-nucleotidase-like hydrolase
MNSVDPARGLYCNRTLNLRSIQAIGYDMDYTLIHYNMKAWEGRAYSYIQERLSALGWPVDDLAFDHDLVTQGLIIDLQEGNIVKSNRFGYIKRAYHGTKPMGYPALRETYQHTLVDLHDLRWKFMNTLFSISEACMYLQLVDLLDREILPSVVGYDALYRHVRQALDQAHFEGMLKAEIIGDPDRFVELDPEMPLALLDQKEAGKRILLITNSEWDYAAPMLSYAFDRFLPGDKTWRDLFDLAIVGARKPDFFSSRSPAFRVVDDQGLLREQRGPLETGSVYVGGNAALVEASLGLNGEQFLYVGDHIFSDVKMSKQVLRWRTVLILRELEDEIAALADFEEQQDKLMCMMERKEELEAAFSAVRLELQRNRRGYGPQTDRLTSELEAEMTALRNKLVALDEKIAPLAEASSKLMNPNWGSLMRTGKDKSHFARQVEQSADVYTARVSNFLRYTPFVYLRSHRGNLPHDPLVRPVVQPPPGTE